MKKILTNVLKQEDGATALEYAILVVLIAIDRKSTRLNSSHAVTTYAVFCLKKKYLFFFY